MREHNLIGWHLGVLRSKSRRALQGVCVLLIYRVQLWKLELFLVIFEFTGRFRLLSFVFVAQKKMQYKGHENILWYPGYPRTNQSFHPKQYLGGCRLNTKSWSNDGFPYIGKVKQHQECPSSVKRKRAWLFLIWQWQKRSFD